MNQTLPTVSVILPARDSSELLPEALATISRQTYPRILEVIVAAADEASAKAAGDAVVVDNPTGSTPAGLNLALSRSSGEVIVRCDAQSRLPIDYIAVAVETLVGAEADNVGGMQVPVGHTVWEKAIAAAMESRIGAGDARYRVGGAPGPVETVYLGVFKRSTLVELGGFDEAFARTQDYELNHRIISAGGKVWFDPRLRVEYRPRGGLLQLASQYYQYGRAKRLFSRKHPGSLRLRQILPPLLLMGLTATTLLSLAFPWLALAPLSYVGLILTTSMLTDSPSKMRTAAALATMHLSWGWGFVRG